MASAQKWWMSFKFLSDARDAREIAENQIQKFSVWFLEKNIFFELFHKMLIFKNGSYDKNIKS